MSSGLNQSAPLPEDYPITKCDKCGGIMFVPAIVLRDVPGLVLGIKQDVVSTPAHKVFRCANCGAMLKSDLERIEELNKTKETTEQIKTKTSNSNLIL